MVRCNLQKDHNSENTMSITHRDKSKRLKFAVWLPYHSDKKTEGQGNLAEFIFALATKGCDRAPETIKTHFKHTEVELPSDPNGNTLYLLSQGTWNGKHYSCFATSGNKYLKDNYEIRVSDEPYPGV